MNLSNFQHALVALLIQCVVAGLLVLFGGFEWYPALVAGGFAGVFFFAGREHSQFTYKLAKRRSVSILLIPWYEPCAFWRWSRDSRLDLLFPLYGCFALVFLCTWLNF